MYAVDATRHVLPVVDVSCLGIENLTGKDKHMYSAFLPNMGDELRDKLCHAGDSIESLHFIHCSLYFSVFLEMCCST